MRVSTQEKASRYLALGEYEQALREYHKLLEERGETPDIYNLMGEVYLRKGELPNAVEMYKKSLDLYTQEGLLENALAIAKKINRCQEERGILLSLVELASSLHRHDEAMEFLEKFLGKGVEIEDVERVSRVFKKIAEEIANDAEYQPRFERLFVHLQEVLESFGDKSTDLGITIPEPVKLVTEKEQEVELREEEISSTEVVMEEEIPVGLKEELPSNKETLVALVKNIKGVATRKIHPVKKNRLKWGKNFLELGFFEVAIEELQQAIKEDPKCIAAYELLGVAFLRAGEPEYAIHQFKEGLEMQGGKEREYLGLHYNLALTYEMLGRITEAIQELEKISLVDITYKDAWRRLKKLKKGG